MLDKKWESKDVLITGGLGFIGSNLAHSLVDAASSITLLDAKLPGYGANSVNIERIRNDIQVVKGDVRNSAFVRRYVDQADVVYHCAAQLSRTASLEDPETDITINCTGTVNVLDAAAQRTNPPRVVFLSSQAAVGEPESLPIDGLTPANPMDVYGANKRAGEHYCSLYCRVKDVPTVVVRLSNVYGPRAQLLNSNYGVINRFIRLALVDETLPVFKPGSMQRDFVYVEDVAAALEQLGLAEGVIGDRYMLGSGVGTTIRQLATLIVEEAGSGEVELVPWPNDWDSIRVGDLITDPSTLESAIPWQPATNLRDGIQNTLSYYRANRDAYLTSDKVE